MKTIKQLVTKVLSHSLAKNSVIVFAGSMMVNFSAYLFHVLVGRILGPMGYGELAALLALSNILTVPSASLQTVLVKYFSQLKAKNRFSQIQWLFVKVTKHTLIVELIFLLLLIPFLPALANFLQIHRLEYFIWLYLAFASFLTATINASLLQAFQLFTESTFITNLGMILRLILGVVFAPLGVGWVLISNIFSNLLTYLASFVPIRFIFKISPQSYNLSKRKVIGYSIPTLLTGLGITALYSQDVILVKHFFSPENAGIYSSLSILGRVIFFATTAIGFVAFPIIAEYHEQRRNYQTLSMTAIGAVAVVSFGITMLYFLWPKIFVDFLFGKAFSGAVPYMGMFGLFISFFSLSSLVATMCLAAEKTLVSLLVGSAAFGQIILIFLFHSNLYAITFNNILISGSLFVSLLIYFAYAKR